LVFVLVFLFLGLWFDIIYQSFAVDFIDVAFSWFLDELSVEGFDSLDEFYFAVVGKVDCASLAFNSVFIYVASQFGYLCLCWFV
jgi:hypothetical protein